MPENVNEPIRISIFLPSIETGGLERNAILVANHCAAGQFRVSVVFTRVVDTMRARFGQRVRLKCIGQAISVPFFHPRLIDAFVIFRGFVRHLRVEKRRGATLVLSFQSNIIGILAARLARVPVVVRVSNHPVHARYSTGLLPKVSEKLKLIFYRYADAVITNSEITSEYYRAHLPVLVRTIYNPVDLCYLEKKALEGAGHPWLLSKECPVIISVGRLAAQKNFVLLLNAFSKVVGEMNARLIILGEGGERKKLESLAVGLGIDKKVDFPGYHENVHGMVAKADLFVLSSNFEGLPNALLEALAVGTPAVSTDCLSGPSEILCNGAAGDLVPVDDVDALANAIIKNLRSPDRAQRLLKAAKDRLRDFEQSKILGEYVDLLLAVSKRQYSI
ncbi:MAG TPA: glycosyltransferase [Gammaproteobacteria bacterium]|nr:glycosyltransferase [Gammaproteobacteria bacterium]